jgi:hypothetical protein
VLNCLAGDGCWPDASWRSPARSASWNQITTTNHASRLLTRRGVGPNNAAALLIAAGDNPDGLRSDAFAALCGVSPLEASSGRTSRRRLHRGGDRQANSALHRIALSRLRWDTRTRNYLAHRTTEGRTLREAIRCLKCYIAREIYQIITAPPGNRAINRFTSIGASEPASALRVAAAHHDGARRIAHHRLADRAEK